MMEHKIPREELAAICAKFDGQFGLYAYVADTKESFALHEDEVFYSASVIKIPILALLLREAEAGRIDLSARRVVAAENRVGGSGILQSLGPSLELSVLDIAVLMMVLSDNTATNETIDVVGGIERVNEFCREQGLNDTVLCNKLMKKSAWAKAQENVFVSNRTSVRDLAAILTGVVEGTFLSSAISEQIHRIMMGQRLGKFKPGVPAVNHVDPTTPPPLPGEGTVLVASKGGTLTGLGISHDCAIFTLPDGRRYVLCLCTKTKDNRASAPLIAEVAAAMYRAMA